MGVLVQFRTDEVIKAQALEVCKRLGLDLSSYLRMCMSRLAQENGIPFSMKVNPVSEIGVADDEVNAKTAKDRKKAHY